MRLVRAGRVGHHLPGGEYFTQPLPVIQRSAAALTPRELAEDCKAKARSDTVNVDEKPQLEVPKRATLAPGSTVQPKAIVARKHKLTRADESVPVSNLPSKLRPIAFGTDERIPLCLPTGLGKINVTMLTTLNEFGKWRRDETAQFYLDSFKIIHVAPMEALVQQMVGNFRSRLALNRLAVFIVGIADGLLANTRKESEIKTEGKSIIGLLSMLGVVLSRLCLLHLWPTKITIELFRILALVLRVPALASPSRDQDVRMQKGRRSGCAPRSIVSYNHTFRLPQGRLIGLGSAV
ncbi:predicted protein [Postia placenta Mad-698-R]|nr:predicted protein [Postia placenta Mad-698-R]